MSKRVDGDTGHTLEDIREEDLALLVSLWEAWKVINNHEDVPAYQGEPRAEIPF